MRKLTRLALIFGISIFFGCGGEEEHLCLGVSDEQDGLVTTTVGITEYGALYGLGVVMIWYDDDVEIVEQINGTRPRVGAVNNFFRSKGYTPKVRRPFTYSSAEVVDIGYNVSTIPYLKKLNAISGVTEAYLNYYFPTSQLLFLNHLSDLWITVNGDETSMPKKVRFAEVGRTKDGLLYEFGVVLVQYKGIMRRSREVWDWWRRYEDATEAPMSIAVEVNIFFARRGYTPKVTGVLSDLEVIEIGECVDVVPMLKELKAIHGIANVYLNVLYADDAPYPSLPAVRGDVP